MTVSLTPVAQGRAAIDAVNFRKAASVLLDLAERFEVSSGDYLLFLIRAHEQLGQAVAAAERVTAEALL